VAGLKAQVFIADRGYDTDAIVEGKQKEGMEVVIPPRVHRKVQRQYDQYLYKLRHLVENAFLTMKQWRGIASRYAKRLSSYLASVQIRSLHTWLKIIS
jgi:transposase